MAAIGDCLLRGKRIQKLPPPQQLSLGLRQLGVIAYRFPMGLDHRALPLKNHPGLVRVSRKLGAVFKQVLHRLRFSAPKIRMAWEASLPLRGWGQMSYAGVKERLFPSQNAAWFRAWSSVLPQIILKTRRENSSRRVSLGWRNRRLLFPSAQKSSYTGFLSLRTDWGRRASFSRVWRR